MSRVVDEALKDTVESQRLDFKQQFDPASPAEWCELIKDIVAMANSGGGVILIGLKNDGSTSGIPPTAGQPVDPAAVDDKLFKYTDQHLPELRVVHTSKGTQEVVAIVVPRAEVPIVFTKPGTYAVSDVRQQTAFGRGTVYFRHGAKSDVGTVDDIRTSFERHLATRREEWLGNIRRVVEAPAGALIHVVPAEFNVTQPEQSHVGVRLVHDPAAPAVPHWNPDDTHPHRLKELLVKLNGVLSATSRITSYDVQCVRRAHAVDSNPNFYFRSRHGSPQYSDAFFDWMVAEFRKDSGFFRKARTHAKNERPA